ncbi:MAG: hypothetical protein JRC87_02515 [Deltaproteobacteria bacterium]|nr:hypothetical protein [Deltaproteobacteria bacterium]MBW2658460.1 hypothetical protein [Deltaproteobacteria bacterium]
MSYGYYPKYVTVAEKRSKAKKKIKQLQKKNPGIRPVILDGQALAKTWWGKAWNTNLESYADYSNRIGRGRSYVRHCAVLDLKITPGKVTSLVQGSMGAPYEVIISFNKMKQKNWQTIKKECQSRLSSLPDLLAGKIPKALQEIFMVQGKGLFPTPSEITFDCSCPDWASMCKHVAATLYGVGARLDEEPALFFTLRQAAIDDLVSQAVQKKTSSILKKTTTGSSRIIADDKLSDLFGLDMDDPGSVKPAPKKKAKKHNKKAAPQDSLQGHPTAIALVAHCLDKSPDGLGIKELQENTGFPARKLYGILHRLKQQGRVKNPAYGFYKKALSE